MDQMRTKVEIIFSLTICIQICTRPDWESQIFLLRVKNDLGGLSRSSRGTSTSRKQKQMCALPCQRLPFLIDQKTLLKWLGFDSRRHRIISGKLNPLKETLVLFQMVEHQAIEIGISCLIFFFLTLYSQPSIMKLIYDRSYDRLVTFTVTACHLSLFLRSLVSSVNSFLLPGLSLI